MKKRRKDTPVLEVIIICVLFAVLSLGSAMNRSELEETVQTVVLRAENKFRMLSYSENMKGE